MSCGFPWLEILKAFGFGVGLFVPAYIANWFHVKNQRKKEKDFNLNNLVLLEYELEVIRFSNDKIRKTCHLLIYACKEEGELMLSKFPHIISYLTLESILGNLIQYPNQDNYLLEKLLELKSNLLTTNESLDFYFIQDLLSKTPKNSRGESIERYFIETFKYLNFTDQLIHNLKIQIKELKKS